MASLNVLRGSSIAHCSPLAEDEVQRLHLTVRDSVPSNRNERRLRSRARLSVRGCRMPRIELVSSHEREARIEVDEQTAEILKARAAARGMTVSALDCRADRGRRGHAYSISRQCATPAKGPGRPKSWPKTTRRLAEFRRTRWRSPWDDVKAWMQTWGTPNELPAPKPRKLWSLIVSRRTAIADRADQMRTFLET